jgi:signal transduction histidine kinase
LVNPKFENFFDIGKENVLGKSLPELESLPQLASLLALLKQGLKGISRKELEVREGLIVEVSTVPLVGIKKDEGILIILHDKSREKLVERMKTEFVSLAAHQLRTPLSAIKWTLGMFLDGDLGTLTQEQREFVSKTYQSNERMISLINDLLDVTRIEEGRYVYKSSLISLVDLVDSVIKERKEEIKKKDIKLSFKKPLRELPRVMIDAEKIKIAIENFLDNAVKYTPPGGKIIVSLRHLKENKEIEFSVKDTGVGIPEDQRDRVFSKFFRGANVVRMDTEGSGLGLFISKNIIESHGGTVWFESKENEGTVFHFVLPEAKELESFLQEF